MCAKGDRVGWQKIDHDAPKVNFQNCSKFYTGSHIPHPVGFDTYIFPKQIFEHRRVKSRYVFVSGKEVSEAEPSDDGAGYGADFA